MFIGWGCGMEPSKCTIWGLWARGESGKRLERLRKYLGLLVHKGVASDFL